MNIKEAKIGQTILYKKYEFLIIGISNENEEIIILIDEENYHPFSGDDLDKGRTFEMSGWQIDSSDIKSYNIDPKYHQKKARYFSLFNECELVKKIIIKQKKKKLIIKSSSQH